MLSLYLQEGVVGGFIPPIPRKIIKIVPTEEEPTSALLRYTALEMNDNYRNVETTLNSSQLHQLYDIITPLKALPTPWVANDEDPGQFEDVYRLDTTIAIKTDNWQWSNPVAEGCVHIKPSVQPTEEEQSKFKKVVDEIVVFVDGCVNVV